MRLVLLVVAIAMIYHVIQDINVGAEPPTVTFKAPPVPPIDTNVKVIRVHEKEPDRIWSTLQFVDQKDGKYTTYLLVFTNFRIEPIRFYVEADKPISNASMRLPGVGFMMNDFSRVHGKKAAVGAQNPLLPNTFAVISLTSEERIGSANVTTLIP